MKNPTRMDAEGTDVFKIVLLGDVGVGKTALLVRFLCRRYLGEYDPTIEDAYSKKVSVDGKTYIIEVLDTADKGEGSSRRKDFMSTARIFIIAFSTIDSKSFQSVLEYQKEVEKFPRLHQASIGLVGTKSDLTHLRSVPRTEAQSLATNNGWLYSECSAAYDINVQSIFHNMIRTGRGDVGFNLTRKVPDKQLHKKKSLLNKFSAQFLRKRSHSRPVEISTDLVPNGIGKASLSPFSPNDRNMTRRRSYSVTTMI